MEDIVLLHRSSLKSTKPFGASTTVWKTCLRQIAFFSSSDILQIRENQETGDEKLEGVDAFAFLLEVICGLRSPIIGETEVFGQFKNFVFANAASSSISAYFKTLIESAKNLRAQHLVGLGSQGYGSLVRKLSKSDSSISILGSGQLAAEILPWLVKEKKAQVICRNPMRATELKKTFPVIETADLADDSVSVHACLVVAAPLCDKDLLAWLEKHPGQVRKILDLRGELEGASLFADYHFISLKDVFANIEKNKSELDQKVVEIKSLARSHAEEYWLKVHHRPFGWEDLCV